MNVKLRRILCGVFCFVMLCCQFSGATVFAATEEDSNVEITRIAGAGRSETAVQAADVLKNELGVAKFDRIILANGLNFADALAGSYLAAVKSAPILLYSNAASVTLNEDYIMANLSADGIVYLLGGSAAVPQSVEDRLVELGITVKRLYGSNRFGTNLAILEEAGVQPGSEILVETGLNFADSLSASATGKPILLVNGKGSSLTADQRAYLAQYGGGKITILGGSGAVSASIEAELRGYGEVNRLAGASRYATSTLIAKEYFGAVDTVVIAYGLNFPDGLSGGPVAYAMNAPLVLTAAKSETEAKKYVAENSVTNGYIMGGTGALSDRTVELIFDIIIPHTHSYTVVKTVGAKCFEDGYKVMKCSCGDSYKETIERYWNHDMKETNYVAPTYTENGYTEYTCNRCGEVVRNWIDKLPDPNVETTPEPTPTPKPEVPDEIKWCGRCGTGDHDVSECDKELSDTCPDCGRKVNECRGMPIDWVCETCGASVGAWQCHPNH